MIQITPFRQSDDSRCGPACVRMILDYFRIDETEDEIAEVCGWTYEKGCDDAGMKKALEHFGLGCSILNNCDLGDIEYWVNQNIPVIVDWFADGTNHDMPNGHSSVIVGIDRNRIHLMDPWIGAVRSITRSEFDRVWFDWKNTERLEEWKDVVLRQIIVAYPNRLMMKRIKSIE